MIRSAAKRSFAALSPRRKPLEKLNEPRFSNSIEKRGLPYPKSLLSAWNQCGSSTGEALKGGLTDDGEIKEYMEEILLAF